MRDPYEKIVLSRAYAAPAVGGERVNEPLKSIATLAGGREAVVTCTKICCRCTFNNATGAAITVPTLQGLRAIHGQIQVTGPAGTGNVPMPLFGDEIAGLNALKASGSSMNAGFVGGTFRTVQVPAGGTVDVESTLLLMYAGRQFTVGAIGVAGKYDGAIDASLFGNTTTINITGMFAVPVTDVTVTFASMDIVASYATCEEGEHLAPLRPQYKRFGRVDDSPITFGVGELADIQELLLVTPLPSDAQLAWMEGAENLSVLTLDGVPILNQPLSQVVRAPFSYGSAGLALSFAQHLHGWQPLLSSAHNPQATARHVASQLELQGMQGDPAAAKDHPILLGFVVFDALRQDLDEWARKRGVDLSKGGYVSGGKKADDLSQEQAIGIAPRFTSGR